MPKKTQTVVRPRVKLWLEKNDEYVFGLGISNILKAVDQTGSIKKAAASPGEELSPCVGDESSRPNRRWEFRSSRRVWEAKGLTAVN